MRSAGPWILTAKVWADATAVPQPQGRSIWQITIFGINPDHRNARLRMGIYDRRFRSRGYGREAVRRMLQHTFDDLNLHWVALRVAAYHVRAIHSYQSGSSWRVMSESPYGGTTAGGTTYRWEF